MTKRFHTYFRAQTKGKLGPSSIPTRYIGAPDVVAELLAVANDLIRPSAEAVEDFHLRKVGVIKAGQRIEKLARMIEVVDKPLPVERPLIGSSAHPSPLYRRRRSRRELPVAGTDQLQLTLQ